VVLNVGRSLCAEMTREEKGVSRVWSSFPIRDFLRFTKMSSPKSSPSEISILVDEDGEITDQVRALPVICP